MPTNTFHAAIYLALGLYRAIIMPENSIPNAENANATVPVTKLKFSMKSKVLSKNLLTGYYTT